MQTCIVLCTSKDGCQNVLPSQGATTHVVDSFISYRYSAVMKNVLSVTLLLFIMTLIERLIKES